MRRVTPDDLDTAARFGVMHRDVNELRAALAAGADPNLYRYDRPLCHYVAEAGRADLLAAVLEAGADVKSLDFRGSTMAHNVVLGNGPQVGACLRLLIDAGCDLTALNKEGTSPSLYAAGHTNIEAIKITLDAGCDPYWTVVDRLFFPWRTALINAGPSARLGLLASQSAASDRRAIEHGKPTDLLGDLIRDCTAACHLPTWSGASTEALDAFGGMVADAATEDLGDGHTLMPLAVISAMINNLYAACAAAAVPPATSVAAAAVAIVSVPPTP